MLLVAILEISYGENPGIGICVLEAIQCYVLMSQIKHNKVEK